MSSVLSILDNDDGVDQLLEDGVVMLASYLDAHAGVVRQSWSLSQNDFQWFFDYALRAKFAAKPCWKTHFRIRKDVYDQVLAVLCLYLTKQLTKFRAPIKPEQTLAAFSIYTGHNTSAYIATQLAIGTVTVNAFRKEVSRLICKLFRADNFFPTSTHNVLETMDGFEQIAELPYCMGAIDGIHLEWHHCPTDQIYEYRCYKGYLSVVMFAVCAANHRETYVHVGKPGVFGDASKLEQRSLLQNIEDGVW